MWRKRDFLDTEFLLFNDITPKVVVQSLKFSPNIENSYMITDDLVKVSEEIYYFWAKRKMLKILEMFF